MDYQKFIDRKQISPITCGHDPENIPSMLFPF